jgi:hypothetical protein
MLAIHIILEEPAWPELTDFVEATDISIAALPHGMDSGATSVVIRLDLPDGSVVLAQTSLALLLAAGRGIAARYPSPAGTGENAP